MKNRRPCVIDVNVDSEVRRTALGKVLLAALRPDQFERYLARTELKAHSPKSITEIDPLRQEIEEVPRAGVAFDDGEFDPEVRCVVIPVLDFTGQTIGGIGISGPIWRISIQTLSEPLAPCERGGRPAVRRVRIQSRKDGLIPKRWPRKRRRRQNVVDSARQADHIITI